MEQSFDDKFELTITAYTRLRPRLEEVKQRVETLKTLDLSHALILIDEFNEAITRASMAVTDLKHSLDKLRIKKEIKREETAPTGGAIMS